MATDENHVTGVMMKSVQPVTLVCVCVCLSGHGEPEDLNGHDVDGCCQSALPPVHFPHPTEYEVKSFSGVNVKLELD